MPTRRPSSDQLALAQALGEMTEAHRQTTEVMKAMSENLKTLNDRNILHQEQTTQEHKSMILKLDEMVKRYWWLILALIAVVFIVLGYKEAIKLITAGTL